MLRHFPLNISSVNHAKRFLVFRLWEKPNYCSWQLMRVPFRTCVSAKPIRKSSIYVSEWYWCVRKEKKWKGTPKKLTDCATRRLIREAGKGEMRSGQPVNALQPNLNRSRVRQILSTVMHLRYNRTQRTPITKRCHIIARLGCCKEKVIWTQQK